MRLPLHRLHPHPLNSNVMPEPLLAKLAVHIGRTGRYPPIIVRPYESDYQILDGHHRVEALRRLEHTEAQCDVWEVDDAEGAVLLATLNRLQGSDDPLRRSALLDHLRQRGGRSVQELAKLLPEDRPRLEKLLSLRAPPRLAARPQPLGEMPVAVHFFLLPDQRAVLERRLEAIGGRREEALMALLALIDSPAHI